MVILLTLFTALCLCGLGYYLTGWRWLGYVAASPYTLAGLIVALADRCYWHGFNRNALEFIGRPGGMVDTAWGDGATWGQVVMYDFLPNQQIRKHEHRHIYWCMVLGPLAYPVYVVAGCIAAVQYRELSQFYWSNWFEVDARRAAMVE